MGGPGAGRTRRSGPRRTYRLWHRVGFPGEIENDLTPRGLPPPPLEEPGDVSAGVTATPVRQTEPQNPSFSRGQAEKKAPRPGLALGRSRPGPAPSGPGPRPSAGACMRCGSLHRELRGLLGFPHWPLGLLRTSL